MPYGIDILRNLPQDMDQDTYELHKLANSIILESKQDRPDSTLDSAILLLRQAREDRSASDPLRIDVLRHLSMALLTKFSQIGWVEDFTEALSLMIEAHSKRTMESAYPVCNVFPASVVSADRDWAAFRY